MIASHRQRCFGFVVALALGQPALGVVPDDEETKPGASAVPTLPSERGGQELVGQPWPELDLVHVPHPHAELPESHAEWDGPTITLYRWWTDGCPYCRASLPAIERWREKYEAEGLRTIAVYHPKPRREVSELFVRWTASAIGYHGELAIDADWSALRRATRGWQNRRATSVSFLVDHEDIIRFVHPGPDFFPSDESEDHRQDEDHALLESAIETLLKSLPDSASDEPDPDPANADP